MFPRTHTVLFLVICFHIFFSLSLVKANEEKVLQAFPYGDASEVLRLTQNPAILPASKQLDYAMASPPKNLLTPAPLQVANNQTPPQIHLPNLRRDSYSTRASSTSFSKRETLFSKFKSKFKTILHTHSSSDALNETAYSPVTDLSSQSDERVSSPIVPTDIAFAAVGSSSTPSIVSIPVQLPTLWELSRRPRPNQREKIVMRLIRQSNPKWSEHEAHTLAFLILKSSETHRIDYRILSSLIATESSFRLDAVSRTGAKGLGQLKDATAEWLGVRNAFDPIENLNGTAKYLSFLADQFPNDPSRAVASYNVGQGTVKREGLNEPAIQYILKVQNYLDLLLTWGAD